MVHLFLILTSLTREQVMRSQGLGIVIEAGEGSKCNVGDFVSGAWGECHVGSVQVESRYTIIYRLDGVCCNEGQGH